MSEASVLRVMGGATIVKYPIHSSIDFADMIITGLSPMAVQNIQLYIGVNDIEMAKMMHMSPRTYNNRKTFKGNEGDRAYRIAKVVARAEEVIGSHDRAIEWLQNKQPVLRNRIPLELVSTSAGANVISDVLDRIQYGVYG